MNYGKHPKACSKWDSSEKQWELWDRREHSHVSQSGVASCCCILGQGKKSDLRKAQLHDSCNMGIVGQAWVSSSSLDEPHAHVNVPKDTYAHICSKLHRAQITSPGREESQVTICPEFFKADASSYLLWAFDVFLLHRWLQRKIYCENQNKVIIIWLQWI